MIILKEEKVINIGISTYNYNIKELEDNLSDDGNIIKVNNLSYPFVEFCLRNKDKIVLEIYINLYAGTYLGNGMNGLAYLYEYYFLLLNSGFPQGRIVFHFAPIPPDKESLNLLIRTINLYNYGKFFRYKLSFLKVTNEVLELLEQQKYNLGVFKSTINSLEKTLNKNRLPIVEYYRYDEEIPEVSYFDMRCFGIDLVNCNSKINYYYIGKHQPVYKVLADKVNSTALNEFIKLDNKLYTIFFNRRFQYWKTNFDYLFYKANQFDNVSHLKMTTSFGNKFCEFNRQNAPVFNRNLRGRFCYNYLGDMISHYFEHYIIPVNCKGILFDNEEYHLHKRCKEVFVDMKKEYLMYIKENNPKPGDVFHFNTYYFDDPYRFDYPVTLHLCFIEDEPNTFKYEYIEQCFGKVTHYLKSQIQDLIEINPLRLGVPAIGSGTSLDNYDKYSRIESLARVALQPLLENYSIYYFRPFIPEARMQSFDIFEY